MEATSTSLENPVSHKIFKTQLLCELDNKKPDRESLGSLNSLWITPQNLGYGELI